MKLLDQEFIPVKDEIYQLLLSAYCYNRKFSNLGERIKLETREYLLEEVTALRLMCNEIIVQLCKLDDDNGKWTLRKLKKESIKHIKDQKLIGRLNNLETAYRSSINILKTKHRNAYIAHRNADEYPDPFELHDFRSDLSPLICDALEFFEALWGHSVYFGFKLGSMEVEIDLKLEVCFENKRS